MFSLEFYNPSGNTDISHSHARRLPSLDGQADRLSVEWRLAVFPILPVLKELLETDFPGRKSCRPTRFPRGPTSSRNDNTIEAVKNSGVDAVIVGNAACGGCSTACGVAAGRLEASGIPTVTLTREDFVGCRAQCRLGRWVCPPTPFDGDFPDRPFHARFRSDAAVGAPPGDL